MKAGPAEAVGLEPFVIGYIPFYVVTVEEPYAVEGSGPLEYDEILVEEWGSYEVELFLNATITGECLDNGDEGELSLEVCWMEHKRLRLLRIISTEYIHGKVLFQ